VKYADNNKPLLGDVLQIDFKHRGVVVAYVDAGQYAPGYKAFAYLGEGLMVDTDFAGLVHYTQSSIEEDNLRLLKRGPSRAAKLVTGSWRKLVLSEFGTTIAHSKQSFFTMCGLLAQFVNFIFVDLFITQQHKSEALSWALYEAPGFAFYLAAAVVLSSLLLARKSRPLFWSIIAILGFSPLPVLILWVGLWANIQN
jgi:hypothetical protein